MLTAASTFLSPYFLVHFHTYVTLVSNCDIHCLQLARVPGYEAAGTDVPVLLIYWFPSSPNPSTTIVLDSTVVVPLDKSDKTLWNAHCLDIIHATSSDSKRITRRMTVGNQSARDAWVLTLTQALLDYEKCKAQVKKQKQAVAQQREQQNNVTSGTCTVNGNGSNISIAGGSCCANPRPAPIIHSTIGGRHALVLHQNHSGGTRIMQPRRSLPSDYSEDQFMTIPTTPTNEWKSPLRSVLSTTTGIDNRKGGASISCSMHNTSPPRHSCSGYMVDSTRSPPSSPPKNNAHNISQSPVTSPRPPRSDVLVGEALLLGEGLPEL